MTIPQHPFRAHWQPIEIEAFGYRFADTIEAAALEAITTFCEQHPNEVAEYPIGLFPATDYHDPEWTFRVEHYAHLLGVSAGDTVRMCNTWFTKGHKPSNHIRARIKSHVYTTE